MAKQYQSHSEVGRTKATAQRGTSSRSNAERNINTSTKQGKKKKKDKRDKVFSIGFVSMTLLMAIIMFFVCFTIGVVFGPDLPI